MALRKMNLLLVGLCLRAGPILAAPILARGHDNAGAPLAITTAGTLLANMVQKRNLISDAVTPVDILLPGDLRTKLPLVGGHEGAGDTSAGNEKRQVNSGDNLQDFDYIIVPMRHALDSAGFLPPTDASTPVRQAVNQLYPLADIVERSVAGDTNPLLTLLVNTVIIGNYTDPNTGIKTPFLGVTIGNPTSALGRRAASPFGPVSNVLGSAVDDIVDPINDEADDGKASAIEGFLEGLADPLAPFSNDQEESNGAISEHEKRQLLRYLDPSIRVNDQVLIDVDSLIQNLGQVDEDDGPANEKRQIISFNTSTLGDLGLCNLPALLRGDCNADDVGNQKRQLGSLLSLDKPIEFSETITHDALVELAAKELAGLDDDDDGSN